MKIIKQLVEEIREEIHGAEEYAKRATQYKEQDRQLADNYMRMAETELGHVDALHAQAVRLIKDQKSKGTEVPAGMQAVWDWEHEYMTDHVTRIKLMLDMYKR